MMRKPKVKYFIDRKGIHHSRKVVDRFWTPEEIKEALTKATGLEGKGRLNNITDGSYFLQQVDDKRCAVYLYSYLNRKGQFVLEFCTSGMWVHNGPLVKQYHKELAQVIFNEE